MPRQPDSRPVSAGRSRQTAPALLAELQRATEEASPNFDFSLQPLLDLLEERGDGAE